MCKKENSSKLLKVLNSIFVNSKCVQKKEENSSKLSEAKNCSCYKLLFMKNGHICIHQSDILQI